ncbi:MAG: restriction endonuclease subunit S [Prevotella sp.]|jgi:type I restriction enzyme S subunit
MIETNFKDTEIGKIPADWEVTDIFNLTEVVTGGTPNTNMREYWGGNIRWMNSGELNLKFVHEVQGRITQLGYNHSSTKQIPANCVLIGLAGQGKTRGTAAYNLIPLCINQSIGAIIPKETFSSLFLYYYIDSKYSELRRLSSGEGGRGGLTKQLLLSFVVPLPNISEQRRIAAALSKVDSLIESIDKLIAKKQAIKKGAMQELLTGKKRLPGFKGEWIKKKVLDIAPLQRGFDLPNSLLQRGDYPVVYSNGIGYYNKTYMCKAPGVITGRSGTIGNVTFIPKGYYWPHNTTLWVTSFKGNEPLYISYLYKSLHFEDFMTGTGVPTLNRNSIHALQLIIPTLSEQRAIAHVLSSMDSEIEALERKRDKYKQVKQGMMQDLLTGRIRLTEN